MTLGDLHGNPIKLIHFLLRHQIIRLKDEVKHVEEAYQQFVSLYEQYGEILQEYLENRTLLQFTQVRIDNSKERIANLDKQLIETNKKTQQYQTLTQLRQQTLEKLHTAEEEQKKLNQKLSEPKNKLADCVAQFNHFMVQLQIGDNQTLVRLLGDEVADRGNCDYFTLRILNFLHRNHCPLTILVSNHGSEFIYAYEQLLAEYPFVPQGYIGDFQTPSFWGLKLLLDQEIMPHSELIHLVNESYKSTLKILDYTISAKGITLFSHAPIRFDALQWMAKRLEVNYDDSTIESLAKTIDQMNHQFQSYIESNTIHSLFHTDAIHDRTNMSEQERAEWPLVYFFWNRWDETKETETARPAIHNGYTINYVHGHDGFQSTLPHIYNLDTPSGKEPRKTEDQQIDQAFRYLIENRYKIANKTPSEIYLRNVLRYKVFNSDERRLEPKQELLKTSPNNELDGSIKKLSLLGKSVVQPSKSLVELPTAKPSTRELIIASEEQEDKVVFFSSLNLINKKQENLFYNPP
ncbi:Dot/Icm T4SS effector Wip [Legionella parisiensis]|uniref:coiled-coil domain-containing protein n=1 Tax=Legionella parisiensis TaxID=45071 RepID=UPI0030B855AA